MFGIKFSHCGLREHEKPTVSGLAVTPSDMARLTAQGRVIAQGSLESFAYQDGVNNPEDLPMQYHRGVDINDAWERSHRVHDKLKKFKKAKEREAKLLELSQPDGAILN